ncbi:MAG TPA: hypothetical protein VH054_09750 [Polyangiaceae bacterium]|nr:hypothetical protein [Polyangiaceae bacterium]
MFSLAMLTHEASRDVKDVPRASDEPRDAPPSSLRDPLFAPVLAAPVAQEEKVGRVRGWVFVAAFVAMIAPVVAVTVFATRTPARAPVATASAIAITSAETKTSATEIASTEASASASATATATIADAHNDAPCMCMPPPRPKPIPTATTTVVKRDAPKCCPGENEMQCAMRRSVGATCG